MHFLPEIVICKICDLLDKSDFRAYYTAFPELKDNVTQETFDHYYNGGLTTREGSFLDELVNYNGRQDPTFWRTYHRDMELDKSCPKFTDSLNDEDDWEDIDSDEDDSDEDEYIEIDQEEYNVQDLPYPENWKPIAPVNKFLIEFIYTEIKSPGYTQRDTKFYHKLFIKNTKLLIEDMKEEQIEWDKEVK